MKYVISRYNNDISWLKEYSDDYVIYDRSEVPMDGAIVVPNIGSDLYDKFTYIIDNYDNLPDVAVYTKGNLFKFIPKEQFDLVKDNTTFTPLFDHTIKHDGVISKYEDGMYKEVNNGWYMNHYPKKYLHDYNHLAGILHLPTPSYIAFSPGSSYIVPKENILKHPKEFYVKLRDYVAWDRYPAEAQIIERSLYYIWKN